MKDFKLGRPPDVINNSTTGDQAVYGVDEDLESYDCLPPYLRKVLRQAITDVSGAEALEIYREFDGETLVEVVREIETDLFRDRRMCAAVRPLRG